MTLIKKGLAAFPTAGFRAMIWLVCAMGLTVLTASPALAQAPVITTRPLSKAVMEGQAVTFTVGVSDATGVSYQWIRNGKVIAGANTGTLTLPSVTLADRGWYRVAVSNASGTATSVLRLEVGANNTAVVTWGSGVAVPSDLGQVLMLAASGWNSPVLALKPDGTVRTWDSAGYATAALPTGLTDVVGLTVGNNYSGNVAVKSDGTVIAWASTNTVPAGLGQVVAVANGYSHTLALKADGTVVVWGSVALSASIPAGLHDVVAIAAGDSKCFALLADGTVATWGGSGAAATVPRGLTDAVAIAAGSNHNLVLRANGAVQAWGSDYSGSTVVPAGLGVATAIATGANHSLVLLADGTVAAFGYGYSGQTTVPPGLTQVSAIAATANLSLALAARVAPSVQTQPQGNTLTVGDYMALSVTASGLPPLTYQWKKDGVALANGGGVSGVTTANLAIDGIATADAGNYTVEVTNSVGTVISDAAALTVKVPPVLTGRPHSQVVTVGQPVSFSITATDPGTITYQWKHNGQAIAGATGPTLNIASASFADRGYYEVLVSNGVAVSTSVLMLTVSGGPTSGLSVVPWGGGGNFANYGQMKIPAGLSDVVAVSAGINHALALKSDGTVTAWGLSNYGATTVPAGLSDVVAVAAAATYSMALKADGRIVTWGDQTANYMKVPASLRGAVAIAVRQDTSIILKSDGTVDGPNSGAPAGLTGVVAVSAGSYNYLALKADGTVVGWGVAALTPPGNFSMVAPAGLTGITAIGTGWNDSFVLSNNGKVTGWGNNDRQQLAVPAGLSNVIALEGGVNASFALLADGTVTGWGNDSNHDISGVANLGGVAAISCAPYYGLALAAPVAPSVTLSAAQTANTGSTVTLVAKATGYPIPTLQWRRNGAIIAGATSSTLTLSNVQAADAGDYTLTAVSTQGTVTSSALTLAVAAPVSITARTLSQMVLPGQPATVSVTASGAGALTYQWRHNGVAVPGATGASYSIAAVTAGDGGYYDVYITDAAGGTAHSVTYLNVPRGQGSVMGWGWGFGAGAIAPASLTDAVAVATGFSTGLALRANGTVQAWTGSTPPSGLSGVVAIAAGDSHQIALKGDGTIVVWGGGGYGENDVPAGLNNVVAVAAAGYYSLALRADGTVVTWGYGSTPNPALTDVVAIAVGGSYLAVKSDGTVTAWGGSGSNLVPAACTEVVTVATSSDSYVAARRDGTLVSWGANTIAPPTGSIAPVAMAANSFYAYVLKADGSILSWGSDRNNSPPYNLTLPPGMPPVFTLAAGASSIVAVVPAPLAAPSIVTQPLSQTVTYGQSATFTVEATGTPVLIYQWLKNGSANNVGSTTNTLILNDVQESDAGTYSVRVRNGQGNVVSANAVLTVQKTVVSAQSTPVAGGSVTLTVNAPTATAYQWRYRGAVLAGQTAATLTLTNLSRAQNGDYDVVLTTPEGTQTAFSYRLDVQPAAMPDLYQADITFAPRFEQEGAGSIKAAVQLPDGKFLVGGDFTRLGSVPALYLARLNADGSVDSTFTPPLFSGAIQTLIRQADGKIYAGGDFTFVNQQRSGGLVRLNADYSIDPAFAVGQGFDGPVLALAPQDDGRLFVGGEFSYYGTTNRTRLARLNPDGTLDAKFAYSSGVVRVIRLQDDGKVIIAGGNPATNNSSATGFITRALATGDSDWMTWANNGTGTRSYNYPVYSLVRQSDGRWLVGCRSSYQGSALLERLTADGVADTSFAFSPELKANAYGVDTIVLAADGKVLVAGQGLPLSRLTSTGALDATQPALPYVSGNIAFAGNESDGGLRFWGLVTPAANAIAITGFTVLSADGSAFGPFVGAVPRRVAPIYDAQMVAPNQVLVRGGFTHVNDLARTGLVRLTTDGTVDDTFQAPPLPLTDTGRLVVQGDGRILAHDGVSLIRLQSDGARDASFAVFTYAPGDAMVDHDGKVLIANGGAGGYFGTTFGVLRLTQAGALDPAFSTTVTGKVTGMVLQSNGRIVLGGQYGSVNGTSINGLTRVMTNGTLDQSYLAGSTPGNYPLYPAGNDLLYVSARRLFASGANDDTFTSYSGQTAALILPLPDNRFLSAAPPQANYLGIVPGMLGRRLISGALDSSFAADGLDGLATTISRLLLLDDGSLWVFGSKLSALGAPRSGIVRLTAATPLSITAQPISVQAGSGGSTSFSITVAGNGPFAYQWYRNGQKISGATAATLALSNLTQADVATYTVVVTGPFGSLTSAPAALTGLNPPPSITTQPVSQIATAGSAATFSVIASGTGSLTYQWRRSGFPVLGATDASYTIPQASRTDAGIYDVVVSDGLSATTSDGVKLDVAPRAYPGALQVDLGFSTQLESPSSTVNAIVPTGDGKFIVSGDFTRINGVARPGLARVDESFVVDETFSPPAFFADLGYGFADTSLTRVMAIQPDGKIMVTHALPTSSDGLQRNTLIRLLADGSVDPSFAASSELVNVAQLALQPDGRMIVIGGGNNVALPAGKTYVCRLMADGSMDSGYTPLFGTASAPVPPSCVTVQADGKALFSNSSGALVNGQTVGSIVRLTADGAVDPTFVLSGMQSVAASAMAVQPDGKLLIGGTIRVGSSFSYVYLVRLSADGAWEASPMSESYVYNAISKISIGPDGRIWVGAAYSGSWTVWGLAAPGVSEQKFTGSGSTTWWAMCPISGGRLLASASAGGAMRYAADTTLDGVQAQAMTSSGIRAYAPAAGGKFYVAGDFTQVGGIPSYHLARLNSDGTLDQSFAVGMNFYKAPENGTGYAQTPATLLVLPDGRLLVSGNFVAYQQKPVPPLICLLPDGTLDSTFTATGSTAAASLVLLRDGRVLANGTTAYFSDGSRDASFVPALNTLSGAVPLPNGDVLVGSPTAIALLRPDGTTRKTAGTGFNNFSSFGVQPDGKILLGGSVNTRITSTYFPLLPTVRRMTADLVADTAFVQSGLPTPLGTTSGYTGPQLLVQEDGRIILNDYNGFYRLAASGAFDPSFVLAGARSITDYTVNRGLLLMQIQDDGSLLLGDGAMTVGGMQRRGLVRFIDTAAVIATQPTDQRILIGDPLTLSVAAAGSGGATYQWFRNGTPITGATQPTFTVASALASDTGIYSATVANAVGTVRSADATVYVTATPALSQQITFPVIADHTYGDPAFDLNVTTDSGLPVTLTLVDGLATLYNGTLRIAGTGAITVRASQPGNANFTAATTVERTFNVAKAPVAVTINNAIRVYGSANLSYSTSATGLVNGDSFVPYTSQPKVSTAVTSTSPVGTYPITLTGGSADNYVITFIPSTITVLPATLTATATDQTRVYGAADPVFGITYSGFVNNETADVITTAPTASTSATVAASTGSYPITPAGGTAANYAFKYVSGTLSVTKAPLTATAANQTRSYGAANPAVTITYSGFLNNDTAAAITTPPTATIAATATSPVGIYPITLSGGTAPNYALTCVGGTLTVTLAANVITFNPLNDIPVTSAPFDLSATASSGLPVAFSLLSGPATLGNGRTITITGLGTVTVRAVQAGDANHLPATPVDRSFTIGLQGQQITFAAVADHTYGDAPFTIDATADSALPVTLTVVSGPATITDGTLTLTGAGTVTLRASQSGDVSHAAAADVERTFVVAKAPLTARADDKSRLYGDANPALTITYSGFVNNETASAITAPTESTTADTSSSAGVYPITLTGGAAANYTLTLLSGTLTVAPRDYSGTYFGTFGSGGHWALRVRADGAATYLAYLPSRSSAIVVNLTVNADGTFSIAGTEIKGSDITTVRSLALTGPEAPVTGPAAATSPFTLTGQIGTNGAITGQLSGLNETFSGAADAATGPAEASAGYYTASALGTASGATYAIVSPTGQAFVVTTGASVASASGTVDANGQLTTTTTASAALSLTINASAQTVAATVTPPGASTPITYAGLPDTVTPVARVVNLSVRTNAGTNDQTLIVGLVINGSGNKTLLVRGVGPGIASIVPGALGDPKLRLLDSIGAELEANNDWDSSLTADFARLGASPLAAGSKDAAIYRAIPAGSYSFHIFPNDSQSGIAVAEVYDADATQVPAEVVNISARTQVGTGDNILIAGFVISGNAPKTLLIRGVGPTLTGLGVAGALADPQLYLFKQGTIITSNDNWGGTTELKTAFATVGAGPLASDTSKDAALLVTLQPGVYSAQVSGVGDTTGVGLVEVFLLP